MLAIFLLVVHLFLRGSVGQEMAVNPTPESHGVHLKSPIATTGSIISQINAVKRNEWWPTSTQEIVTQTSPYLAELQHPLPPIFSSTAPPYQYRSDQWTPPGYPDYGYPVLLPHNDNNAIQVPGKYSTVALFIGLLTLFAVIQGAMMTSKHRESMDSLPARRKRELIGPLDFESMPAEQLDILNNDARIRCIQRTICLENQKLLKDLGPVGIKLANYLTRNVRKSLRATSGWDRLVEDAGSAGLQGDDCKVLYRGCEFEST